MWTVNLFGILWPGKDAVCHNLRVVLRLLCCIAILYRHVTISIYKGGVSENRGPQYSTLNTRILIIRTPK